MQVSRSDVIENLSWKLLEVVDQDTLEDFFRVKHVEWYAESDDQTILEDAIALGVMEPGDTLTDEDP